MKTASNPIASTNPRADTVQQALPYTTVYEYVSGHWTKTLQQDPSSIKPEKQDLNPCDDKVYDRLVNSDGVLRSTVLTILQKFDVSEDLTIIFSDGNIGPATLDGVTNKENNTTYHIELNETALANASQEYIAATIIHEVLHVYLGTGNNPDHETMAQKYIYPMANALRAAGFNITYENAVALAWGGLQETYAWKQLVAIDKVSGTNVTQNILNTNIRYKKGELGLGCN